MSHHGRGFADPIGTAKISEAEPELQPGEERAFYLTGLRTDINGAGVCSLGGAIGGMPLDRMTRKNQTTVPKAVTEALGMKPADQFLYEIEADHVILRARTGRLADLVQAPPLAPPPQRPPTPAEIDEAVGRDLAGDDARIRRQCRGSPRS